MAFVRRAPRFEELYVLNGLVCLILAAAWLCRWPHLLLQYFYFNELLALTHLVTLGCVSSLMMGVLTRVAPPLLKVELPHGALAKTQLALFLIGSWGMITHFWIGELTGMSWSAIMVWTASVMQLVNGRRLLTSHTPSGPSGRAWSRGFVAASLVFFFLAASMGVLLGLAKAYDLRPPFFSAHIMNNLFVHVHLASVGWVLMMIFGLEFQLAPTTQGAKRFLPLRFLLMTLGTLGLGFAFLLDASVVVFVVMLSVGVVWQALGPLRALGGRARGWELAPLLCLVAAALIGLALSLGMPAQENPLRGRLQLAYGYLALWGFMVFTFIVMAFKLFPMWVWKERFQPDFGIHPVPGMKELHSETLRQWTCVIFFAGSVAASFGIVTVQPFLLSFGTASVFLAVLLFVWNLAHVLRWVFLKRDFQPSAADEMKFREIFPDAG